MKRYELVLVEGTMDGHPTMKEDQLGEWVKYLDAYKLLQQIEGLKQLLADTLNRQPTGSVAEVFRVMEDYNKVMSEVDYSKVRP